MVGGLEVPLVLIEGQALKCFGRLLSSCMFQLIRISVIVILVVATQMCDFAESDNLAAIDGVFLASNASAQEHFSSLGQVPVDRGFDAHQLHSRQPSGIQIHGNFIGFITENGFEATEKTLQNAPLSVVYLHLGCRSQVFLEQERRSGMETEDSNHQNTHRNGGIGHGFSSGTAHWTVAAVRRQHAGHGLRGNYCPFAGSGCYPKSRFRGPAQEGQRANFIA